MRLSLPYKRCMNPTYTTTQGANAIQCGRHDYVSHTIRVCIYSYINTPWLKPKMGTIFLIIHGHVYRHTWTCNMIFKGYELRFVYISQPTEKSHMNLLIPHNFPSIHNISPLKYTTKQSWKSCKSIAKLT